MSTLGKRIKKIERHIEQKEQEKIIDCYEHLVGACMNPEKYKGWKLDPFLQRIADEIKPEDISQKGADEWI